MPFVIFYRFYIFVLFYPVGDEDVCCLGVYFAIAIVALAGPMHIYKDMVLLNVNNIILCPGDYITYS